jgi:short subunit dehydrogenase-like uncharacterized protein
LDFGKGIFMNTPFLLYGSYGFTGSLIVEQAVRRGMHPILSGRDANLLKSQADAFKLEYRTISVDDSEALEVALKEVPLVLNCAGPFHRTYKAVLGACIRMGRHYLDITGEIPVFEALAARDHEARQTGIMLLPGVGFDVFPSDCLAAHMKERLPSANYLTLAISTSRGGFTRGTVMSAIEGIPRQGAVRKEGKLLQVPLSGKTREFDFGRGPRTALRIPWGDVSTAYYSTGIPNIETYMVLPKSIIRLVRLIRPFVGLAAKPMMQKLLRQAVMKLPPGPTAHSRSISRSRLWGEVVNDQGMRAVSRLETPDGYELTIDTALAAVERVMAGDFKPGFQTPSLAYGADFILEFSGVHREDLELNRI